MLRILGPIRRAPTFDYIQGPRNRLDWSLLQDFLIYLYEYITHLIANAGLRSHFIPTGDILTFRTRLNITFCSMYLLSYHYVERGSGICWTHFMAPTSRSSGLSGLCTEPPSSRCPGRVLTNHAAESSTAYPIKGNTSPDLQHIVSHNTGIAWWTYSALECLPGIARQA